MKASSGLLTGSVTLFAFFGPAFFGGAGGAGGDFLAAGLGGVIGDIRPVGGGSMLSEIESESSFRLSNGFENC